MTTPDTTPMPSAETIALAAEIERKRAVRKAKLQGVKPTGEPIVAMFDGVAYPLGTPLWRVRYWNPYEVVHDGFIAGVCATDPTKVRVGKTAESRAHYANAVKGEQATLGSERIWPTWELARAEARRCAEEHVAYQRHLLAQAERHLAAIIARVDPTAS